MLSVGVARTPGFGVRAAFLRPWDKPRTPKPGVRATPFLPWAADTNIYARALKARVKRAL